MSLIAVSVFPVPISVVTTVLRLSEKNVTTEKCGEQTWYKMAHCLISGQNNQMRRGVDACTSTSNAHHMICIVEVKGDAPKPAADRTRSTEMLLSK